MKKIILYSVGAVGFIMLLIISTCGFEVIDSGNRGVKTTIGVVEEKSYEEGIHFFNPFTTSIHEIETKSSTYDLDVSCYTKDLQPSNIKVSIMISPERAMVYKLYRDYGESSWIEKLALPISEGSIKTVVGRYEAVDLVANRTKAKDDMIFLIKESFKSSYININNLEIKNIDYSDEFEKAIENKVKAVQSAIEAKNRTVEIEENAKQKIITAEAEARSMKIKSDALSQNKSLIDYEAVKKWNGVLPATIMGNTVPFINLK